MKKERIREKRCASQGLRMGTWRKKIKKTRVRLRRNRERKSKKGEEEREMVSEIGKRIIILMQKNQGVFIHSSLFFLSRNIVEKILQLNWSMNCSSVKLWWRKSEERKLREREKIEREKKEKISQSLGHQL